MSRKIYLDILRIIAIFLVVFNHTPAWRLPLFATVESYQTRTMFISVIVKIAIPVFFMISGALLLPKHETIRDVVIRRVARFSIVLLLFHLIQTVYYSFACGENGIGIRNFLSDCYWGGMHDGYVLRWSEASAVWFLYAYIALLLMLPFLRIMVKGMERIHFHYLFAFQMILGVACPALFVLVTGNTPEDFRILRYLPLCGNVLVFVFAGYYAEHVVKVDMLKKKHCMWLGITAAVFLLLATMMPEWARMRMHGESVDEHIPGITPYCLLPCIALYLGVKKLFLFVSVGPRTARVIQMFGGAVFTVMLVENILRREICDFFPDYNSAYLPSVWVTCFVWGIGLLLGMICKKIPLLRNVL